MVSKVAEGRGIEAEPRFRNCLVVELTFAKTGTVYGPTSTFQMDVVQAR